MARTSKKDAAENAVNESGFVTLINSGVALIIFGERRVMPGEEIEIPVESLKLSGVEYHFGQGTLEVKDDYDLTQEIKRGIIERRKKDADSGKSQKEVEDGGEY